LSDNLSAGLSDGLTSRNSTSFYDSRLCVITAAECGYWFSKLSYWDLISYSLIILGLPEFGWWSRTLIPGLKLFDYVPGLLIDGLPPLLLEMKLLTAAGSMFPIWLLAKLFSSSAVASYSPKNILLLYFALFLGIVKVLLSYAVEFLIDNLTLWFLGSVSYLDSNAKSALFNDV